MDFGSRRPTTVPDRSVAARSARRATASTRVRIAIGVAAAVRARLWREDDGFTLVELLVTTVLGLTLFGATLTVIVQGLHTESHTRNRVSAAQTLQTALAEMVSELRPGASVAYVATSGNLGITLTPPSTVTPPGGTTPGSPVTFDCYTTSGTCARSIGGATTQTLATGIANPDVFTLMCRTASGDRLAVANPGSTTGCANAGALDYVAIKLVASVSCAGQGVSTVSCTDGTIEVDGGTALRSQP